MTHPNWRIARGLLAALILMATLAALAALGAGAPARAATSYSLRFFGTGSDDVDRVKIAIDAPHRPVDVSGSFTVELWLRALAGSNQTSSCTSGTDNWITGNTVVDRDIYSAADNGDYGISLRGGRVAFGVVTASGGAGICGATDLRDGEWHHVAVTRNGSTGQLRIYVDGVQDGQGSGPTGDVSYRNGRSTSYPNSDPYLVIGAEKHDVGGDYPSFSGWVDELRISNTVRYTANFTRPTGPFSTDSSTVGLYHFDEGGGASVADSSGAAGGPSNGAVMYEVGNTRPAWSTETPWGQPDLLLTASALPERRQLPYVNR